MNEVYVQPFPATGARWRISRAGGRQPLQRGRFDYGVPHFLFDLPANVFNARNSYVPSRDGQRFLVNMLRDAVDAPITVIHNWPATVTR